MKYSDLLKYIFMAKPNEELHDHSQSVLEMFKETFDKDVLNRFIENNFENTNEDSKKRLQKIFFEFLCDLAYFHDFGKALFGFKKERLELELTEEECLLYNKETEKKLKFNIHPINSYFYLLKINFFDQYFEKLQNIELPEKDKQNAKTFLSSISFIIIYHHISLEDLFEDGSVSLEHLFYEFSRDSLQKYITSFDSIVKDYLLVSENISYETLEKRRQDATYLTELKLFFEFFKYAYSCLIFSDEYVSIYGEYDKDLKPKADMQTINKLIKDYIDYALNLYKEKVSNNDKLVENLGKTLKVMVKDYLLILNGKTLDFENTLRKIFSEKEIDFNNDVRIIENILENIEYEVNSSKYHLQIIRNLILLYSLIKIRRNIENGVNISYLELPTGIGKTNISVGANLLVMKLSKKQKSFYVFPTINIIEQSYHQIKERLPSANGHLSKIYSKSTFSDISVSDIDKKDCKYVIEKTLQDHKSLNYLINVISQVNIFETFFSNRKASNLRLCNFNNSCIVLDEIQFLPERYWFEIAEVTNSFSKLLNIHFVFMSATLPKITELIKDKDYTKIRSIFDENPTIKDKLYNYFSNRNVFYFISTFDTKKYLNYNKHREELNTYKNDLYQMRNYLKDLFTKYKKGLVVVNTLNLSIELYNKLKEDGFNCKLLNSTILGFKKEELLSEFKKSNESILLISTQTIEAGVDLDADFAIREYSPITSISQVGGRVNREFLKNKSPIFIYNFKGDYFKIYRPENKKYDRNKPYYSIFNLQNNLSNEEFLRVLNENKYFSENDNKYLYNLLLVEREKNYEDSHNSYYFQYKKKCLFKKMNQIKIIDSFSINLIFRYKIDFDKITTINRDGILVPNNEIIATFKELYKEINKKDYVSDELDTEEICNLNKLFKKLGKDQKAQKKMNTNYYTQKKIFSKKLALLNDFFGCKLNLSFFNDNINTKLKDTFYELFEDTYFVNDQKYNECFSVSSGLNKSIFFETFLKDSNCLIL